MISFVLRLMSVPIIFTTVVLTHTATIQSHPIHVPVTKEKVFKNLNLKLILQRKIIQFSNLYKILTNKDRITLGMTPVIFGWWTVTFGYSRYNFRSS